MNYGIKYSIKPFFRAVDILAAEYIDGLAGLDLYALGDPKKKGVLDKIQKLSDIGSLEGQAQFIGQWNADVYAYKNGLLVDMVDMVRLRKEAIIIMNSKYNSKAAQEIILLRVTEG